MTCFQEVQCCGSNNIVKSGHTRQGKQRYLCREPSGITKTFLLDYQYNACKPGKRGARQVRFERGCEEAEIDEQGSFVGNKSNQRGLWYAIDHESNTALVYVFGKRKDNVFKKRKALFEPFKYNATTRITGVLNTRFLTPEKHEIGKANTQKIERKNLGQTTGT